MKTIFIFLGILFVFSGCKKENGVSLQFFLDDSMLFETNLIEEAFLMGDNHVMFQLDKSDANELAEVMLDQSGNEIIIKTNDFRIGRVTAMPQKAINNVEIRVESISDLTEHLRKRNVNIYFVDRENEERGLLDLFND